MNTFKLFTSSFFHLSTLRTAKNMPFWKVILYLFFLSAVLAIPITKQMFSIMSDIKNDGKEIAQKLPQFKIEDGKLETPSTTKGFIYQTNSIIFTFDPEGKRTPQDIASDSVGDAISLGLLDDKFVLAFPNSGAADSLIGTNQFEISYAKGSLDGLNSQNVKQVLDNARVPFWIKLLVFAFTWYPTFIDLIINLFLITLGASLYSKIRLLNLRFLDCLKIAAYCLTFPVFISSLFHLFNRSFDDSFLIIFASLMFFFFAVHKEERRKPPLN